MAINISYMSSFLPKQHSIMTHLPIPSLAEWHSAQLLLGAIMILVLLLYFFHISTWRAFETQRLDRNHDRIPPLVPYMFPVVGSAIRFALNPAKCLAKASKLVGPQAVWGLKILNHTLFFLHGPENVAPIWKYKTTITTPGVQTFCLIGLFGMSLKAVDMYTKDNSGILPKAEPYSEVASHNRIDYLTHAGFHKLLIGDRLANLYKRWSISLTRRLALLQIGDSWTDVADIMDFWMPPLTASLNEAMTGPILERINPNFTRDFLEYLPYVHDLMKGLPRLLVPRGYVLRDSLIRDVKNWHAIARAGFTESSVEKDGDADPWWGSEAMRERQRILGGVDNWDHDSIASSDFGLLWGAGINVHTAGVWTIIEIFRDKALLSRVREELRAAGFEGIKKSDQIEKLLLLPLLQSVHAEVLRLRVEVQSVFYSEREEIRINEWRFPKKSLLLVPTGAAHRDEKFWNTKNGVHPLNEFWADRFLLRGNDPQSGPRKRTVTEPSLAAQESVKPSTNDSEPKFISSGLANSYMPFGVGERACPGRFFARREIIGFCAQIVHQYDIEISSTGKKFEISSAFYGLGTQRPLHKIPFRIRRRAED